MITTCPEVGDFLIMPAHVARVCGILIVGTGGTAPARQAQHDRSGGRFVVNQIGMDHDVWGFFVDAQTNIPMPSFNENPKGWYLSRGVWAACSPAPPRAIIDEIDEPSWQGVIP